MHRAFPLYLVEFGSNETLGDYAPNFGIVIFLTFILHPFVEMFYASLRPLDHLFRSPYQFYSDDLSFWAYKEMWNTVPLLGRYIFNSFFLATCVALITLLFVIPAAYSYARFSFPGKNSSLYLFLAVNMFAGAVLLIPLYKVLRTLGLLNTYQAMIVVLLLSLNMVLRPPVSLSLQAYLLESFRLHIHLSTQLYHLV